MNTRLFGVLLALACWVGLVAIRALFFRQPLVWGAVLLQLGLVLMGAIIFWQWITVMLERQAQEVRQRTRNLEALHAASIALTTEHDLTLVLQKVVDLSRSLLNAKYGALGILDEAGEHIEQIITSGISPAVRNGLDHFPHEQSLPNAPIVERQSIRIANIEIDPRARGFPAHHPAMHSFLGVPIVSKGRIFGNLYLADKQPSPDGTGANDVRQSSLAFTQEEQEILEMFANQAAIAIENVQLYHQNQQIAVLQERERFGVDLHDGVIQSLYAIGLMLDDSRHRLEDDPSSSRAALDGSLQGLNQVIDDIRHYIHNLRNYQFEGRNLQQGLEELAREVQMYSVARVRMEIDSVAVKRVTPPQTKELLYIVREALTNIRKHAHASEVTIQLVRIEEEIILSVQDNGLGLEPTQIDLDAWHGLRNMRERALALQGKLEIESAPNHGTTIRVTLPA